MVVNYTCWWQVLCACLFWNFLAGALLVLLQLLCTDSLYYSRSQSKTNCHSAPPPLCYCDHCCPVIVPMSSSSPQNLLWKNLMGSTCYFTAWSRTALQDFKKATTLSTETQRSVRPNSVWHTTIRSLKWHFIMRIKTYNLLIQCIEWWPLCSTQHGKSTAPIYDQSKRDMRCTSKFA